MGVSGSGKTYVGSGHLDLALNIPFLTATISIRPRRAPTWPHAGRCAERRRPRALARPHRCPARRRRPPIPRGRRRLFGAAPRLLRPPARDTPPPPLPSRATRTLCARASPAAKNHYMPASLVDSQFAALEFAGKRGGGCCDDPRRRRPGADVGRDDRANSRAPDGTNRRSGWRSQLSPLVRDGFALKGRSFNRLSRTLQCGPSGLHRRTGLIE